jgi:hypothetical protein
MQQQSGIDVQLAEREQRHMNDVCKETNSFGPRAGGKGIKPSSAFRLLPGLSSQYHLFCQKPKTGVPGSSMPPIQKTGCVNNTQTN